MKQRRQITQKDIDRVHDSLRLIRKSPWFNQSVNPVHHGVYEIRRDIEKELGLPWFRLWNGEWCVGSTIPSEAQNQPWPCSDLDDPFVWRGIRTKPKT